MLGRLAAIALLLGGAGLPSVAEASPKPSALDREFEGEACDAGPGEELPPERTTAALSADRRVDSSWTLSSTRGFQILSLSDGPRGELYLGTPNSGALRLQADSLEPLPPVSVDNGLFRFRVNAGSAFIPPDPVKDRTHPEPRARLTGIRITEKGEKPSAQKGSGLIFSFRGIDLGAHSSRFRYRLTGMDTDWLETNRCSVHYKDLPPGPYRFEVKAVSGPGRWSEPTGFSLTVLDPPLWRQPAFLLGLATVGLALAGSLYAAARARRLLHVERLRASIAADLHDQVGAGLTDIAILSEVAARKAGDLPELDRVAATARELVDGMGDIVWLVNPRHDSLYELFLRLKDSYAELFSYAGAQLEVGDLSLFEGARLPMPYRQDLHLLFKEALRNALRHSGCRRAELSVSLNRRHLEIELRDDGQGFDPERRNGGGEGMETMRRRAERLGGHLTIDSSPGGTAVRFAGSLP